LLSHSPALCLPALLRRAGELSNAKNHSIIALKYMSIQSHDIMKKTEEEGKGKKQQYLHTKAFIGFKRS
jgi:hypothetical protein